MSYHQTGTQKLYGSSSIEVSDSSQIQPSYCHTEPYGLKASGTRGSKTWDLSAGTMRYKGWTINRSAQKDIPLPDGFTKTDVNQYIYLKYTGNIVYRSASPSITDPTDEICLGVILSLDEGKTVWLLVPFIVDQSPLTRQHKEKGTVVISGCKLSFTANSLNLNRSKGVIRSPGRNWFNDPNNEHIIQVESQEGISWRFITQKGELSQEVSQFDFGAAGKDVSTILDKRRKNDVFVWRIYISSIGSVVIAYPIIGYRSMVLALAEWKAEPYTRPEQLDGFYFFGAIFARISATEKHVLNYSSVRFLYFNDK